MTLDLADPAQRARAVEAVWGPPHLRVRQAAKAGGAGGTAGGLFEGCGGCEGCEAGNLDIGGEAAVAILVIVVAAIAAIALYFIIKRIVHAIREYRARPRPTGSRWKPSLPPRVLRGTITDAGRIKGPLSGDDCAAWGLMITHDRALEGHCTLRDGETAGITVKLDDGRSVRIPAGRVRVDGESETERAQEVYLRTIDPYYAKADETPVIPADDAHEVRLAVGDRIAIIGGLAERFDPNAPAGYRETPETLLVLEGVPSLVRVSS